MKIKFPKYRGIFFVTVLFLILCCSLGAMAKTAETNNDAVLTKEMKDRGSGIYEIKVKAQKSPDPQEEAADIVLVVAASEGMDCDSNGNKAGEAGFTGKSRWQLWQEAADRLIDTAISENSKISLSILVYGGSNGDEGFYCDHKVLLGNATDAAVMKAAYHRYETAAYLRQELFNERPNHWFGAANGDAGFYGADRLLATLNNHHPHIIFVSDGAFDRYYDTDGDVKSDDSSVNRGRNRAKDLKTKYPDLKIDVVGFGSSDVPFLNPQEQCWDGFYTASNGMILQEVFVLIARTIVTTAEVLDEIGGTFDVIPASLPFNAHITKEGHVLWTIDNLAKNNCLRFFVTLRKTSAHGVVPVNPACSLIYTPPNSEYPVTITRYLPSLLRPSDTAGGTLGKI